MMRLLLLAVCLGLIAGQDAYAQTEIWNGDVLADGTPSQPVKLTLGKKYQIKVSGSLNLGKWWQAGHPLGEDASYEFSEQGIVPPSKAQIFRDSMGISLNDEHYSPQHVYSSQPFVAKQNLIHFWIHDTDYTDNNGSLRVQVIQLD